MTRKQEKVEIDRGKKTLKYPTFTLLQKSVRENTKAAMRGGGG